jgi:sugar transferase (PEP-CTERM system associated)
MRVTGMTRIFGHYVAPEMVGLWLIEFLPCLLAIYLLLSHGSASGIDVMALNQAGILAITIGLTSIAIGLYRPEICLQTRRLLVNTAVAALMSFPLALVVGKLGRIDTSFLLGGNPTRPLQVLVVWIVFLYTTRFAFSLATRLNLFARRMLIVGNAQEAACSRDAIRSLRRGFFTVAGIVPVSTGAGLSPAALRRQRIWGVIVTSAARASLAQEELLRCKDAGIHFFTDIEFREQQLRRIDFNHIAPDWMLFAAGLSCGPVQRAIRRAGDVLIALALMVLTLPVMLLTVLMIRLDSPGPVLYRQQRVGLHGRPFMLLKFRSMRVNAEAGGPAWAARRDSRVTRVGQFIRRTRIDELPQLLCVLRGEMGFVGPRPERPHFVDQLAETIPFYRDRSCVKPGLTGWAQVNFPYGASIEDARQKLAYDLYYVKHRSLFLDMLILFATVRVILFQEGSR